MKTFNNKFSKTIFSAVLIMIVLLSCKNSLSQFSQQWETRINASLNSFSTSGMINDAYQNQFVFGSGTFSKINSSGNVLWTNTLQNDINCMSLDLNGNIYIAGSVNGNNGSVDIYVRKYNTSGSLVWQLTENTGSNWSFHPTCISVDNNGNIFLASSYSIQGQYHQSSSYLFKFDNSGSRLWYKSIYFPTAVKMIVDPSGNVLLAGYEISYYGGPTLNYVNKYDNSGNILNSWQLDSGYIKSIFRDNTGNIYATGTRSTMKISSAGIKVWQNMHSFAGNNLETDNSGNLYVTGSNSSDAVTVKFNSNGQLLWQQFLNGPFNGIDASNDLEVLQNGDVVICGESERSANNSDYFIAKYTSAGALNNAAYYNSAGNLNDEALFIKIVSGNNFVVSGKSGSDICILKFDDITAVSGINSQMPEGFKLNQNYPNPFNPSTKISFSIPKASYVRISVFDISGKEVEILVNENLNAGTFEVEFNATGFSSGIYFCRISAGGFSDVKKMILAK